MSNEEIWRDIPGWEGLYQASSLGGIRSLDRTIAAVSRWGTPQIYSRGGKILKPKRDKDGYLGCRLVNGARNKHYKVHQLVCMAFYGPCPTPAHIVAHGDGVRDNCREDNLRWATQKENHADRRIHGTHPSGELHPRSKLTRVNVDIIRARHSRGETQATLASEFGVKASHVGRIVRNQAWAA